MKPRRHLKHRVQASQSVQPAAGYTPVTGGAASPGGTPMVMPLSRVTVARTGSQYVTVGMEGLTPVFTPDGAAIPASAPGRWAQLKAAGRP